MGMKVAISIPDDVFNAGEKASRRMGVSRSRFYAEAVREYAKEHSGAEITRRLNQVYPADADEAEGELPDGSLEVLRRERW
jgi:metal-responsive CopG/Arc/MetJ family transcriptional regulator